MNFDKILKVLSLPVLEELDGKEIPELEKAIAQSEESITKAARDRDADKNYRAAKQAVSDLSAGLRDVKKYQNAKIQFCLLKLRAAGQGDKLGDVELEELAALRVQFSPKGKKGTL